MRKAIYSRKQVICPNASYHGYSKVTARAGDFLTYRHGDEGRPELARMVGRIEWCDVDGPNVKGHLAVLTLSSTGYGGYLRWVNPAEVIEVYAPEHITPFLAWFAMSPADWRKISPEMMERLSEYGTLSSSYVDKVPEHLAEWAADGTK